VNCVRWELQGRAEAAETLIPKLAEEDWATVITSRLVSFVDFRAHESRFNVEKRARLPWFEELVRGARKASAYLPKLARTVEQVIGWLDTAVGTSLAVAINYWKHDPALKGDFLAPLMGIVAHGEGRWKPKHWAMLINSGWRLKGRYA